MFHVFSLLDDGDDDCDDDDGHGDDDHDGDDGGDDDIVIRIASPSSKEDTWNTEQEEADEE